jgi:acetylglutamate kinase
VNDLFVVKIGGNVLDDPAVLSSFMESFANIKGPKILVHGGGKKASAVSERLGVPVRMHEGRRITDNETLDIAVMVYAGLINKQLVASLQAYDCQAIGICGADGGCMPATRRSIQTLDYGFVGDIQHHQIQQAFFINLLEQSLVPVFAPITHDGQGQLLNTNADSVAAALAIALGTHYHVHLVYCFEKKGVLRNVKDEKSLIAELTPAIYTRLRHDGLIRDGMIPKLDNAFAAISAGVDNVFIGSAEFLLDLISGRPDSGTRCHADSGSSKRKS